MLVRRERSHGRRRGRGEKAPNSIERTFWSLVFGAIPGAWWLEFGAFLEFGVWCLFHFRMLAMEVGAILILLRYRQQVSFAEEFADETDARRRAGLGKAIRHHDARVAGEITQERAAASQ